jgi:hypothetical protein
MRRVPSRGAGGGGFSGGLFGGGAPGLGLSSLRAAAGGLGALGLGGGLGGGPRALSTAIIKFLLVSQTTIPVSSKDLRKQSVLITYSVIRNVLIRNPQTKKDNK